MSPTFDLEFFVVQWCEHEPHTLPLLSLSRHLFPRLHKLTPHVGEPVNIHCIQSDSSHTYNSCPPNWIGGGILMVSVCGHIRFESHLHKMGSNCGSAHHKDGMNTDLDREARIIFVIFLTYTCTHHHIYTRYDVPTAWSFFNLVLTDKLFMLYCLCFTICSLGLT